MDPQVLTGTLCIGALGLVFLFAGMGHDSFVGEMTEKGCALTAIGSMILFGLFEGLIAYNSLFALVVIFFAGVFLCMIVSILWLQRASARRAVAAAQSKPHLGGYGSAG